MRTFLAVGILLALAACQRGREVDRTDVPTAEQPVEVMVLGTFHFTYPNLDAHQTGQSRQVDIMSGARQAELQTVIDRLLGFRPDRIAIEVGVEEQARIDSLYGLYRADRFELPVGEQFQIAFRMARELGHERVYCIDTWGDYERFLDRDAFWDGYVKFLESGPDTALQRAYSAYHAGTDAFLADHSLIEGFRALNRPEHLQILQGAYFLNGFSFELEPYDYGGADWEASRWYDRNLRIFRNIKRLADVPGERVFVLFGAGHHALLRDYIEYSPRHRYVPVLDYLRE